MFSKYFNIVLAVIILVFSFWNVEIYSYWIIVIAAALVLISELFSTSSHGMMESGNSSMVAGTKDDDKMPSEKEIAEVMSKKK